MQIHTITRGPFNRYLIGDSGWILVDTGIPRTERMVLSALREYHVAPRELRLILLTHGHIDHAGAAAALKRLTGARVAIHERDRELVETGRVVVPAMWNPAVRAMAKPIDWVASLMRFPPVPADIVIHDEGLDLAEFGVRGRVIYTPGHTVGSISLVLDSGEAFVGDLGAGVGIGGGKARIPPAGNDRQQVLESWRRLFALNVTRIYPGHGPDLPASEMRAALGW
ncbi:MAG: Metallo-beta-lactamase L1 precursor [Chloroflexi bacterium ADurb.Bin180]|nr:MAG: Metallo-beta-lactamase L1 precursor [Chloroflexi bacterium ADurb.Bin180]